MPSGQDKGWNHRRYDSYRPATKRKAFPENHSPIIASESEAVRYRPNKSSHRATSSSNTAPRGDASSTPRSSRGQSLGHSPPAASVPDKNPPFLGHDPEQLTQMLRKERNDRSMPDTAPSRHSSCTAELDKRNESEAQRRGFYGSSRSSTSNGLRLAGYDLKRPGDDEATDRSIKRRRGTEEDGEVGDEDEDEAEPTGASDKDRPPRKYWCKNYMCMRDHAYSDCDKERRCWGCRSTSHYWSYCPMTCTRCGQARHTATYCQDFELDQDGKSRPRAYTPHTPTEPASYRAQRDSLLHAHGEDSLPKKPAKVMLPNRGGSERQQASHNDFDPKSNPETSRSQKSARIEEGVSESTTDRDVQQLRGASIPGSGPKGRTSTTKTSGQLTILTGAAGRSSTPPLTQPSISPRDPRLRHSTLTPLVAPLDSLQMSLDSREVSSVGPQMLGEPLPSPFQFRPLGVGATPSQGYQSHSSSQREAYIPPPSRGKKEELSQASSRKDDPHPPTPTQNESHPAGAPSQVNDHSSQAPTRNQGHLTPASAPDERPADDSPDTMEARMMQAFEEEERVKQERHEAELAEKGRQQRKEFAHELQEKIKQKKHDADAARRAALQTQDEEHERRLAELRRR